MAKVGQSRIVLSESDRRALDDFFSAATRRLIQAEEVIDLAAWRNQTTASEWTNKRFEAAREAIRQLSEAVERAGHEPA